MMEAVVVRDYVIVDMVAAGRDVSEIQDNEV